MSEGSFVCSTCDYSFACEGLLIAHSRFHVKKEKNCGNDEFEVLTRFSRGSFVCNTCNKSFACEEFLIVHNKIHVKEEKNSACDGFEVTRPSITEIFSQSSTRGKGVPRSSVQNARGTSHKPSISVAFSKNPSSVNKQVHLDITNNLQNRSNTGCGERNPRNFVCNKCNKHFKHQFSLTSHYKTHINSSVNKQVHLDITNNLQNRSNARCGERNPRNFVCDKCNKCFKHQFSLTSHYKTHINYVLRQHSRVIKEPRSSDKSASRVSTPGISHKPSISVTFNPNSNSEKEYYFGVTNNLPQQFNTRKQKNFVCGKCNKRFKKPKSLTDHYRIHIKFETAASNFFFDNYNSYAKTQRPNTCDICGIIFRKKMEHKIHFYVIHKMKGLDEIYCCNECGQSFNKLWKLELHTRRLHKEKLIKCDMCSKTFLKNKALKQHYTMHIGESSREWHKAKSLPFTVKDPVLVKEEPIEE